ncbi:MAG TPA: Rieske 2Fe-2S domain-containing protein [Acidimicrobiales bacterium]|nr:Rieske 2Fe-2S domain-containing protein [Acidimicrobiales bacterium]
MTAWGGQRTPPAPSEANAGPNWTLLALRAFLGVTYVFAGLQKLADRQFVDPKSPGSVQAQIQAAQQQSPVGGLLTVVGHHAVAFAVVLAFAELLVGVATLLGMWARVAAAGGLLLAVGFLLTVSWHTHPYYLGPDIVFVFAWTPLLVAGPDPVLSVDSWLSHREAVVRDRMHIGAGELDRRAVLARGVVGGGAALLALVGGGLTAVVGRLLDNRPSPDGETLGAARVRTSGAPAPSTTAPEPPSTTEPASSPTTTRHRTTAPSTTTEPPTTAAPSGIALGPASAVPVGSGARFRDPVSGQPSWVLQPTEGRFVAFSAVCTHAGCRVGLAADGRSFHCPCHGAVFDASTGQPLVGPARRPLASIPVLDEGGVLYRAD